jgi:hypothetical protein
MTEETRDPKVSARYRELGAEEPPRALDEAILAASRRAAQSHPAPLVAPTGRRAWFVPLAAAAVLVLAVSVTLHVQFEQPGGERIPAPAERPPLMVSEQAQKEPQAKSAEPARQERKPAQVAEEDAPARSPAKLEARRAPQASEPRPFAADSAREARMRQAELERELSRSARSVAAPASVPAPPAMAPAAPDAGVAAAKPALERLSAESLAKRADAAAETPEKELERIARLRSEGRHEEADKALAEFRKRYPDFRIPAPMLERVERR